MKGKKWVLYQDNLRVHTNEDSKKFLEENGIEYVFAPVYSPELNAIEFYFSQLKDRVKKAILKAMIDGISHNYEDLVQ